MTRHLELGLFLPSTRGGSIIAKTEPPQEQPTFALNLAVTRMAEDAGMEFVLAQSKYRGYGGVSEHWDHALESFTLCSALAAGTTRIRMFGSVGVRAFHPAVIAKMAVTVDDVSQGRFGVNIVAGWNQLEYGQMGMWPEDGYHTYRYAYAEDFLKAMLLLWEKGRGATYKGKFFTLEDCVSLPKPQHRIPLVCAGQSDDALAFTARYADYGFVGRLGDTPEALGALQRKLEGLAASHGRKVGAYALLNVIADETVEAAEARRDFYVANADDEAIAEWQRVGGRDPTRNTAHLDKVRQTFMGFPYIVSSFEGVARRLDAIAEAGITGVSLMFPDYQRDLGRFIAEVMPRMRSRGGRIAGGAESAA